MFAEQNKRADIPAHDEHTNGSSNQSRTDGIHIIQVFGCQEKRISPECIHETAVYHSKKDKPKKQ
jgi:hypothetical protein